MNELAIRTALRWLLTAIYASAGLLHLLLPQPFAAIMPLWVPFPATVIAVTGVAELVGAASLAQPLSPGLRRAAGIGLALYALCVWPANFHHMELDMAKSDGGLGLAYHIPRLALQPMLIWLAVWTGEVTRWPLSKTRVK